MGRLDSKVAVITGAGAGIGREAALLFAREGARVVIVDRAEAAARQAEDEIRGRGGDALAVCGDVTDEGSIQGAFDQALGRYGRLDILVNNAGGSSPNDKPAADVDMALWSTTLSVDLLGTFLCCRLALRIMMGQGSGTIVNMSSWAALRGAHAKHIYSAAKGGILSLTRSIAGEYTQFGIRANVICPGVVRTERSIRTHESASGPPSARTEQRRALATSYPFSVGEPIDIANIALFLASDESRMITGATIAADGGRSSF